MTAVASAALADRPMAFLLPDMGGGGAERVALALMEGFLKRGYPVDLVLSNCVGALLPLVPPAVRIFDLQTPRQRAAPWPLARYLRRRRPRAIQAMMWPVPVVAMLSRTMARSDTRIVAAEHTVLSAMPHALDRSWVRSVTRAAYRRADALIAVSAGVADDMARFIGLPRHAIEVIHNPLLLPAALPAATVAQDRWPAGTRRLLAVGAFKVEKNYPLMLEAFARVRDHVDASLLILGDGAMQEETERRAAELGLSDSVVFAGFEQDVWPFFTAADAFVLSSDAEGFGNVLIEAMHAGIPVVSTDCPSGPREILAGGAYGTLVPCGDPTALAAAIVATLTEPPDRDRLRRRAAHLSGEAPIDRYLQLMLGATAPNLSRSIASR